MKKVHCTSAVLTLATLLSLHAVDAQWIQQPFPSGEYLWKVRFVDPATGWILGGRYVYKTTDAGTHWTPQDTVLNGGGSALCGLNASTAFFAEFEALPGGTYRGIRKTTDGGSSWRTVDTVQASYYDIEFVTPQIGYAACGIYSSTHPSVIRKTTDGGETWSTIHALNGGIDFEAVSFVDPLRGWAVTYGAGGLMFHTTDGGSSWTFQDTVGIPPGGTSYPMRDVKFTTADSGWAIGGVAGTSVIGRTTDGGTTWLVEEGPSNTLEEITMLNSHEGWIVGRVYNAPPWHTTDGGTTWDPQPASPPILAFDIASISMIDQNLGWFVCGGGRAYKTTNGGVVSVEETEMLPQQIHIGQNFPNPFNPSTRITFDLPDRSHVLLVVFDPLGRKIAELVNDDLVAGSHSITWNASGHASGMYIARFTVSDGAGNTHYTKSNKLVLLK